MTHKAQAVKDFFNQVDNYLTFNYNLRIRHETLRHYLAQITPIESLLDIPCGTGEITLPLCSDVAHLTLVDFSENMVATALNSVPRNCSGRVEVLQGDVFEFTPGKQFDVVVCFGLIAHIDHPETLFNRLSSFVKPGGHLVIQNTDARHWFARLIRVYLGLRRWVGKDRYRLTALSHNELLRQLEQRNFKLLRSFSYNQSFLGLSRLFSNNQKYRLTRKLFGFAEDGQFVNRGSDFTCLFQKSV